MSHSQRTQGPHGRGDEAGGATGWGNGPQAETPTEPHAAAPGEAQPPSTKGRERRRLRNVLVVSISALATAITALALLLWGAYEWKQMLEREDLLVSEDEGTTRRTGHSADVDADEEDEDEASDPPLDVPEETEVVEEGTITLVDVGIDSPALRTVLIEQRRLAQLEGQTMLLMLTGRRCDPCRGFDASLADPRMQEALAEVRLVRVDLEVFGGELGRLHLPTALYPAFFLLGPDLMPRDAIHGGEWDADVPANIAPVIGPFVRGELEERRHADWAPTTTSIPL